MTSLISKLCCFQVWTWSNLHWFCSKQTWS